MLDKRERLCNLLSVADTKKTDKELENIALLTRETFQSLLKAHVQDKKDIDRLAKVLGKTPSLVKKMLYKGEGGLDVWIKAFAYLYGLNEKSLSGLQDELRVRAPVAKSDQVWFSIKNQLGASEDEARYLAEIAKESFRIKRELEAVNKKSK